ncbi:hypothetical protein ACJMK2_004008 [Sinanodonta woodiana]|uniref:Uncharacterized protein n=1 Tax=Sinanodonta woodiana TaxID=1069815 RepID=A0ABD3XZW6_SINWO
MVGARPQHQPQSEIPHSHEAHQEPSLTGSRSRVHLYFEVVVEGHTRLAYRPPGCQVISFESEEKAPKQAEILAALHAMEVRIYGIAGLQNAGYTRHVLYPIDLSTHSLVCTKIKVKGRTAHVRKIPLFERQIGPKTLDVLISGLHVQNRIKEQ